MSCSRAASGERQLKRIWSLGRPFDAKLARGAVNDNLAEIDPRQHRWVERVVGVRMQNSVGSPRLDADDSRPDP